MATVLGNVIEFFTRIGIYDVVLPFILVFTIIYAILERTKVFGMEKIGDKEYTKRNLNAMAAFTIAFLVIASSRLVATITEASSNMVVLLMLGVFFLMLIGSFYKEGGLWDEKNGMSNTIKWVFAIIMFIGIAAIFLNAVKTESGQPWLDYILQYISNNWTSTGVASIILIILIIAFIAYLTGEKKEEKK